jgi:predicted DNA-binding transcriptional regulator AlpA
MRKYSERPDVALDGPSIRHPEDANPHPVGVAPFGDKRAVAAMTSMSVRWVNLQLQRGMPHLKLGARRVRFDMAEVAQWLKERYATQRMK